VGSASPATVGVVVNPHAGKDIRRLVAAASHTSDAAKIGIARRAITAAAEAGADRIVLMGDGHRLAERAAEGLDAPVEVLDEAFSGSGADSIAAARRMWKEQVGALVVLGGDGTCRNVVTGWPDAPLVAVSTGTNNVFPAAIDATSAGTAAALVARQAVTIDEAADRCKRIAVTIDDGDGPTDDVALVDVALVDSTFTGARAVSDPATVRCVVAAFATPMSTGLSSIAGRIAPLARFAPGGVLVRLGPGGRPVRVPLSPGAFSTISVTDVVPLDPGEPVELGGPGVLALDGERDRRVGAATTIRVAVDGGGPLLIDVERVLRLAAGRSLFDAHPRAGGADGH
jgi:predicted polyphosphate/ATP-dependent NAD kinase